MSIMYHESLRDNTMSHSSVMSYGKPTSLHYTGYALQQYSLDRRR